MVNFCLCFFPLQYLIKHFSKIFHRDRLFPNWGCSQQAQQHSSLFIVLSLFLIGAPGGLAFLGEDLLFHSLLDVHPTFTLAHIILMALNGIALYRIFHYLFMGPWDTDFSPRHSSSSFAHGFTQATSSTSSLLSLSSLTLSIPLVILLSFFAVQFLLKSLYPIFHF
jgi:hypothetical protein